LIIVPSTELGEQIKEYGEKLIIYCKSEIRILHIFKGKQENKNNMELFNKPNIIIGTASRIIENCVKKKIDLSKIETFVIDEADLVLNSNLKEIKELKLTYLPRIYQCIMTSATISDSYNEKEKIFLNNPLIINDSKKIGK
jgi:ATP-dependent RNA helicase DDX56/DBP9